MMDFAGLAAREMSQALEAEREYTMRNTKWLRELQSLQQVDRARAEFPSMRPPSGPTKLTGAHSPWI